jgi:peptide deformylase
MGYLTYINPKITNLSDEKIQDWEACLSVPKWNVLK